MKVRLTVNPFAGKGKGREISRIAEIFLARSGIARNDIKYDCHVIVGGDGTLHRVINESKRTDAPLVICPAGVGNDFARAVRIPENPEKALRLSLSGKPREVDLIEANGELTAGIVSFGFDAEVNKRALQLKKQFWFLPASGMYAYALLWELFFSKTEYSRAEIVGRDVNYCGQVLLVAIANISCYGRVFKLAPGANPRDGLLDIVIIKPASKLRIMANLFRVLRGTHLGLPEVAIFKTSSPITIRFPRPPLCQMDGEVLSAEQEYQIGIKPKALKVLAP